MERDDGDRTTLTREDVEAAVRSVPFWWHSIDQGGGLVTPGAQSQAFLKARMRSLHLHTSSARQAVSTRLKSRAMFLVAETGLATPAMRLNTQRYRAILHA